MLKFLENRAHDKSVKSPKKYLPQMLYGNSFQSPKQFQTNHTVFLNSTYVNPYISYQKQRVSRIPSQSLPRVNPSWSKKIDLQTVQEHQLLTTSVPQLWKNVQHKNNDQLHFQETIGCRAKKTEAERLKNSRYVKSFHEQFGKNQSRFKKTKGEFTQFIEKNIKFKALGPLHGNWRDNTRIQQTKKAVWEMPKNNSFSQSNRAIRNTLSFSRTDLSLRSSISKNSQLITQKQKIRHNREQANKYFQKSLQKRKENHANSSLFELPRTGPEHQLTLHGKTSKNDSFFQQTRNTSITAHLLKNNSSSFSFTQSKVNHRKRQSSEDDSKSLSESDQMYHDLNRFQKTINSKFGGG